MHEHKHIFKKPKWKALRTSRSEIQYQVVARGEGMEVETRVEITM
jgi:FKBP-type peptidyl-prolyl cis-trans isomerase